MAGKLTCVNIETTQADAVTTPALAGPLGWQTDVAGIRYRKLPTGMVQVQLTATIGSGGLVTSLPEGYRPGAQVSLIVPEGTDGPACTLIISVTGVITNNSSGTTRADCVFQFFAEG